MMTKSEFDNDAILVIGGGIIGSWTALQLVREGVQTILAEQFPFPHTRGSSSGGSRAFRFLGDDDLGMLTYCLEEWIELGARIGSELFVKTGLLEFGPADDPFLLRCMAAMDKEGHSVQWLDARAVKEQYPMMAYPPEWGAAYDPNAGLLLAHKCVDAVQREFLSRGGTILQAKVERVSSNTDLSTVQVRLPSGARQINQFRKVVVCAGPWTSKLFPGLARSLTPETIAVLYWTDKMHKQSDGAEEAMAVSTGFPIIYNARLTNVYCLPSYEYPGLVKVLYHGGPVSDPETRDQADTTPFIKHVASYVKAHFPNLDHSEPALSEQCMYTCTKDRLPIIDRLSEHIVIGAGFSGSGFKHSPASGKMLAYLAMDREQELPDGFRLSRFKIDRETR